MCVCLYLFSQQEDDHCFIIQDIEDQCREGLIMQNYDHLFLLSRYLFSPRGSKERLKLDCQFENKYIQSTCFAREVILLRICRSFWPEIGCWCWVVAQLGGCGGWWLLGGGWVVGGWLLGVGGL